MSIAYTGQWFEWVVCLGILKTRPTPTPYYYFFITTVKSGFYISFNNAQLPRNSSFLNQCKKRPTGYTGFIIWIKSWHPLELVTVVVRVPSRNVNNHYVIDEQMKKT